MAVVFPQMITTVLTSSNVLLIVDTTKADCRRKPELSAQREIHDNSLALEQGGVKRMTTAATGD